MGDHLRRLDGRQLRPARTAAARRLREIAEPVPLAGAGPELLPLHDPRARPHVRRFRVDLSPGHLGGIVRRAGIALRRRRRAAVHRSDVSHLLRRAADAGSRRREADRVRFDRRHAARRAGRGAAPRWSAPMSVPQINRQWRLASYPEGMPTAANWTLGEGPVPEPGPNEMLARAIYLDVAPYMRGRISPQKNYAAGVAPGELMVGGCVGEVVASNAKGYEAGDIVVTDQSFGWQEYGVLAPASARKVDRAAAPLPYWLDALGMNGMTAWFALLDAADMKAGD